MLAMTSAHFRAISITTTVLLHVTRICSAQEQKLGLCPDLAKTFFAKPPQQRAAEFAKSDLDRQFTIYVCGMQYMHPPLMGLAVEFASQGRTTANYLREKLMSPVDDKTTRDIVMVFQFMAIRGAYDVVGDVALMRLLENKVNNIGDADDRALAQMFLNDIRHP